jgi:hypothetical protein
LCCSRNGTRGAADEPKAVTADPSASVRMAKKERRVLWYPTQADRRLEWGTQPLLPAKKTGHPALKPSSAYPPTPQISTGNPGVRSRGICIALRPRTKASVPLVLPKNRHPERSASHMDRVTQRLCAESKDPGELILAKLLGAFRPPKPDHRTRCDDDKGVLTKSRTRYAKAYGVTRRRAASFGDAASGPRRPLKYRRGDGTPLSQWPIPDRRP